MTHGNLQHRAQGCSSPLLNCSTSSTREGHGEEYRTVSLRTTARFTALNRVHQSRSHITKVSCVYRQPHKAHLITSAGAAASNMLQSRHRNVRNWTMFLFKKGRFAPTLRSFHGLQFKNPGARHCQKYIVHGLPILTQDVFACAICEV